MAKKMKQALDTPTDLGAAATRDISVALNVVLCDVFALYLKTKNFHWHMSGAHFRDFHLLLDEHADQIYAMTDALAERVRKVGGRTIRSIGEISRNQRIKDNDEEFVTPHAMLSELAGDNRQLTAGLRKAHKTCEKYNDIASTSLIENWIDEAERRSWFLFESTRRLGEES